MWEMCIMATAAEEVWGLLRELIEAQKETDRKFKETDRKFQESSRVVVHSPH